MRLSAAIIESGGSIDAIRDGGRTALKPAFTLLTVQAGLGGRVSSTAYYVRCAFGNVCLKIVLNFWFAPSSKV